MQIADEREQSRQQSWLIKLQLLPNISFYDSKHQSKDETTPGQNEKIVFTVKNNY